MNRLELSEQNDQTYFRERLFSSGSFDPEFQEIARRFLCGDVLARNTLSKKQKMLLSLAALTTCQTLGAIFQYALAALDAGASPEEIKETLYQCAPYIGITRVQCALDEVNRAFQAAGITFPLKPQAKAHAGTNLNVGNTREMLIEAITQCLPLIGFPRTLNALSCIESVAK